ncbi:MAG: ABC transporter ATP-binding protein [Lachnospiraceae bacterium]|nr:ABC transporter ATP-binding protein [Lachnospiraceae bacterium]
MKEYSGSMILALILSLLGTITTIILPLFIRRITDEISAGIFQPMNLSRIVRLTLIAVLLLAGGCVLTYIQNVLLTRVSQRMGEKLRGEVNDKIDRIPVAYFDTHNTGDILTRLTSDVEMMVTALTNYLSSILSAIVTIICVSCIMIWLNWTLAVIVVVMSTLSLLLTRFLMKRSQPSFVRQQALTGDVISQAESAFNGHIVVKAFNAGDKVKAKFAESNNELLKSSRYAQLIAGTMQPLTAAMGLVSQFLIVLASSYFILGGLRGVTLGVMVAFTNYSSMFSQMLSNLSNFISYMQPAIASAGRIFELLEEEERGEDEEDKSVSDVKGAVTFDHVKFGYVPGETIIHDFSRNIRAGQKIAIVGPTGAGKSTMMNLLMRFYELDGGKILFDDVPIDEIPYTQLHGYIGMVPQEIWTFEGTIRENIVYSTENVSDERLDEILRTSGLDYFVKALPEGVDTVLNETTTISAGQKQLITIARAMAKNSPVLILDEATSSVDTRTEKIIQAALDELMKGRTSFIVAHRLSTIRNADLILVMQNGDVVETGTHDELLQRNGLYADLYNSQFASAESA